MGNIDFITTKESLKPSRVQADLERFNSEYFKGKLNINTHGKPKGIKQLWFLTLKAETFHSFEMGLSSYRRLWFNAGHSFESSWLTYSFKTLLAFQYHGIISSDAISEKWAPSAKYPTYAKWCEMYSTVLKEECLKVAEPIIMEFDWSGYIQASGLLSHKKIEG